MTMALSMHLIVNLMKLHSYNSYNIDLQWKLVRYQELKRWEAREKLTDEEITIKRDLWDELNGGKEMFPANQTFYNFTVFIADKGFSFGPYICL
jgi:hypothetical protein